MGQPRKAFKKQQRKNNDNKELQRLKSEVEALEKVLFENGTFSVDRVLQQVSKFSDFPLSSRTLKGLREAELTTPTRIQKAAIGPALVGRDVLGAAKTGSGKTLAFLVPVLERLLVDKWNPIDGLVAMIITPTRELAYQIFEVLKNVGKFHEVSAALLIGGRDYKFEGTRLDRINVLICTPGRILQHLDTNPLLSAENLQILVLDEADRLLDMGFRENLTSILDHLPDTRQTLLFSATQTRSVKDLALLSLREPVYVSVDERAPTTTPESLSQAYIVCRLDQKLELLWTFLKTHLKQKTLVFLATCKQVKFVFEVFRHLRPGIPLMQLHGKLPQLRRMAIYEEFCGKQRGVLFATDVAARGLDFPAVDWVLQLDCPEEPNDYIHRVGRTARVLRRGNSLLLLSTGEVKFVEKLQAKKIPIKRKQLSDEQVKKASFLVGKLQSLLAADIELKDRARRAFVAYVKHIFMSGDKEVFNVQDIDAGAFAKSLGLVVLPRVRFLEKFNVKLTSEEMVENGDSQQLDIGGDSDAEQDDMFLVTKKGGETGKMLHETLSDSEDEKIVKKKPSKPLTKVAAAKKLLRKKVTVNHKVRFDQDSGDVVSSNVQKFQSELGQKYQQNESSLSGIDLKEAKRVLQEEDVFDKKLFQEKVKTMHQTAKGKRLPDDDSEDLVETGSGKKSGYKDWKKKRKQKFADEKESKRQKFNVVLDTGMSLREDEDLALKLLTN